MRENTFKKVLVANRGEISMRVQHALREMGITACAVYSDADRVARHTLFADEAYPIGSGGRAGVGFGLGFSVRVERSYGAAASRIGEYGWGGMASTHFWISPRDELAVVALTQHVPFSSRAENAVKPIVYDAILDGK